MMPSDPVQREYAQLASQYDQRWLFYVQATIQATLDRLEIHPGEQLLDLGCGTGTFIQQLLLRSPAIQVTGLDPCREMLDIAQQKLPETVTLKLGSANCLPFPDHSFNVVVSTSAFHYFRNPMQALQEAKRVLKPQGRLVITDWCHDYFTCRICDFFLRQFNEAHFHTYRLAECQAILEDAAFQEIAIERYKINWLWGMMTATARKADPAGN